VAPKPGLPVQPTQPRALARLVGAAVLLAVAGGPGKDADLNYRQFIGLGLDVDCLACHWRPLGPPRAPRRAPPRDLR
jgi:hypothetical protein